jgi:hypothetical protein|tara:strand:- start:82 stop:786 length:705 start_codon:yes stop_codon:yes gene_type:complete
MDNDKIYKCVIPLGMRCFTEMFIKELKLKKFSMTFDAMFSKDIDSIIEIMENDIEYDNLIYSENIKNYQLTELHNNHGFRTLHKNDYDENNLLSSFHMAFLPHHNLNDPNVRKHFKKCFVRLNKIKRNNINTLFTLFICPNYANDKNITINDINKLAIYLKNNYTCRLLVCLFKKTNNSYDVSKIIDDNNLIYFHINSNSYNFTDHKNILNNIMNYLHIKPNNLLEYNDIENLH